MHDPRQYAIEGSATEIVEARTAHTKLYRVDAFQRALVLGNDIHYQDEQGVYQEVLLENCFVDDGGGGYRLRRVKQDGQFRGRAAELTDREIGRGIRMYSEQPIQTPISGTEVESVKNGVTFIHEVTKRGMKMHATVTQRVAPQVTRYVYDYEVLGVGTDPLRANADGSLTNSQVTIPRVTVVDAQGISYDVGPWEILPAGQLAFNFDDRVIPTAGLPYVIDPTVVFGIGTGGDDATIRKAAPIYANVPAAAGVLNTTGGYVFAGRTRPNYDAGEYQVFFDFATDVALLRWDTALLASSLRVTASSLRLCVTGSAAEGTLPSPQFPVEVYHQQSAYSTSDWADLPAGPVVGSATGGGFDNYVTTTLSLTAAHLVFGGGKSGLRIHCNQFPGNAAPVSGNYRSYRSFEDATFDEPRLTISYLLPKRIGHVHG